MTWRGWSVNLTLEGPEHTFELDLPVPPMFETSQGPVLEVVFWSQAVERWVHGVSAYFERELPEGHVQVTVGDLAWVQHVTERAGVEGLRECVYDLETCMVPGAE